MLRSEKLFLWTNVSIWIGNVFNSNGGVKMKYFKLVENAKFEINEISCVVKVDKFVFDAISAINKFIIGIKDRIPTDAELSIINEHSINIANCLSKAGYSEDIADLAVDVCLNVPDGKERFTTEIVNDKNGYLLSTNPQPAEIAEIIYHISQQRTDLVAKKMAALKTWKSNNNADQNYQYFIDELAKL